MSKKDSSEIKEEVKKILIWLGKTGHNKLTGFVVQNEQIKQKLHEDVINKLLSQNLVKYKEEK